MRVQSMFVKMFFMAVFLMLWSCKEDEVKTVQFNVKVQYPDNYNPRTGAGIEVTLTNSSNGSKSTQTTNDMGEAVFKNVFPATYQIQATKALSAAEAKTFTGLEQTVTLNAAKNDVMISESPSVTTAELTLQGSRLGNIVIKEVYYTGSKTPTNSNYFHDFFVELYNNSTEIIYLDSLMITDVHGSSASFGTPSQFRSDLDNVYGSTVWGFGGTGRQKPLSPGQSVVIALDGIDHTAININSINLSNADYETFVDRTPSGDTDAPNVPNMVSVYNVNSQFDWGPSVFGRALVVFKPADFNTLAKVLIPGTTDQASNYRIKIPNSIVIDGFDALADGTIGTTHKRVPTALDAGFVFASAAYTKESFRRKVSSTTGTRKVLQDTNNSTNDFENINPPTPKGF